MAYQEHGRDEHDRRGDGEAACCRRLAARRAGL